MSIYSFMLVILIVRYILQRLFCSRAWGFTKRCFKTLMVFFNFGNYNLWLNISWISSRVFCSWGKYNSSFTSICTITCLKMLRICLQFRHQVLLICILILNCNFWFIIFSTGCMNYTNGRLTSSNFALTQSSIKSCYFIFIQNHCITCLLQFLITNIINWLPWWLLRWILLMIVI